MNKLEWLANEDDGDYYLLKSVCIGANVQIPLTWHETENTNQILQSQDKKSLNSFQKK